MSRFARDAVLDPAFAGALPVGIHVSDRQVEANLSLVHGLGGAYTATATAVLANTAVVN